MNKSNIKSLINPKLEISDRKSLIAWLVTFVIGVGMIYFSV